MTSEFTIAVHGIVYLNHKKEVVSSEALARNVCTNPARIRKVMSRLKKAGLVVTKEGVDGGYLFIKEADDISLLMIAEALNVIFTDVSWKSGDPHIGCLISSGMEGVMTEIYQKLNDCCLEQLKKITIGDIDRKIFLQKAL